MLDEADEKQMVEVLWACRSGLATRAGTLREQLREAMEPLDSEHRDKFVYLFNKALDSDEDKLALAEAQEDLLEGHDEGFEEAETSEDTGEGTDEQEKTEQLPQEPTTGEVETPVEEEVEDTSATEKPKGKK